MESGPEVSVQRLTTQQQACHVGALSLRDVVLTGQVEGSGAPVGLMGGITASDDPVGPDGWWPAMGRALAGMRVFAPALAGKGTTWPALEDPSAPLPAVGGPNGALT